MAISKFEDESQVAQDPAVKQFATQQLPALQHHAMQVRQAAVAQGLPGGGSSHEAMPAGARIQGSGTSGSDSSTGSGTSGGTSGTGTGTGGSNQAK